MYLHLGRVESSIREIEKEIEIKDYIISGNGASIIDIKNNMELYRNFMSKNKVLDIIKICNENSIFCNLYTENEVITQKLKYNVLYYYYENKRKSAQNKVNTNIVNDLLKYVSESDVKSYSKITIADDDSCIFGSLMRKIKNIRDIDVLDVGHMSRKTIVDGTQSIDISYNYTEITAKNTNKWSAINFLINKLRNKQRRSDCDR